MAISLKEGTDHKRSNFDFRRHDFDKSSKERKKKKEMHIKNLATHAFFSQSLSHTHKNFKYCDETRGIVRVKHHT